MKPSDARSLNISKLVDSYSATHEPVGLKSSAQVKRIIRSLEEIEDEDVSGLVKGSDFRGTAVDKRELVFSGDYYERNSESMNFREEEPSGNGDWEGESNDKQEDDVTDHIIQIQTHKVSAVKRTNMATVVDPREIEQFETESKDGNPRSFHEDLMANKRTPELSSGESDQGKENTMEFSSASGSSSSEGFSLDDVQDQSSASGSGRINKTIMREVQRNLQKVWRYASSGKNLGMVAKGPKGKKEERKLLEIYNLVIKHESKAKSSLGGERRVQKEAVSGDSSGLREEFFDISGESGDGTDKSHDLGSAKMSAEKFEIGSAVELESGKDEEVKLEISLSGEGSGQGDESASGSGVVNKKLMKEVEHNLHSVWRYAAPKKDLDMVAKGPKGKEEEQKLKKIYNIVSKHEAGSAFIDFELRKKGNSDDGSVQTQKHKHSHKSRKSKVKLAKMMYNATESKLYGLQKARKYRYNKNLKRLKPWGMGMRKHSSARKPDGMFVKQVSGKDKESRRKDDKLALLSEEMKELAPTDENDDNTKGKEKSKEKLNKDETKEDSDKETSKLQTELEHKSNRNKNKSKDQTVVLDRQKPFDKTRLEIGRKLEELILSRIVELEAHRLKKKPGEKPIHLKYGKKETDDADTEKEEG